MGGGAPPPARRERLGRMGAVGRPETGMGEKGEPVFAAAPPTVSLDHLPY